YLRIWYADENALLRQKLHVARIGKFAPWLEEIIRQGVQEGVLTTPYPDQVARMILALFDDFGYATIELLLAPERQPGDLERLERIVEAGTDVLERVLGAPSGTLSRMSRAELEIWLTGPDLEQGEV